MKGTNLNRYIVSVINLSIAVSFLSLKILSRDLLYVEIESKGVKVGEKNI